MKIEFNPFELNPHQLQVVVNMLQTLGGVATEPPKVPSAPSIVVAKPPSIAPDPQAVFGQPIDATLNVATNLGLDAPTEPVSSSSPAVDAEGLPWDDRIHSSNRALNADGTWRKRRGVDGLTVSQVEAQLRQVTAHQSPAPEVVFVQPTFAPTAPPAPVATVAPPPAPAAPAGLPTQEQIKQFTMLMGSVAQAMQQGRITDAQVTQICNNHGVPMLALLSSRLDLVPQVALEITKLIGA